MNVRQLETFVRIVETGSFAAAAEGLGVKTVWRTHSTGSVRMEYRLGADHD